MTNFLLLLDDWFNYTEKAMAREQPFEVELHPHISVEIAPVWDDG